MRASTVVIIAVVVLSFAIGILVFPLMPEQMASHWNAQGEVDDYLPKFWGTFLLPIVLTALALLFLAIPRIDPLKENIAKFRKYYDGFIVILMIFFLVVYLLIVLWSLGVKLNPNAVMPLAIGLIFFYSGILLEHAERNWFIGIRTPWTLSSDNVWKKTHRIGGKLFKIAGVLTALGVFFGRFAVFFVLVPALTVAIYTIVYSYIEWQRETAR